MLPDAKRARQVNQVLRDNGAGAINFGENTWHYYPRWEHLLEAKTPCQGGWPFAAEGKRRVIYDPAALPQSAEIITRTLVYPVPVKLAETQKTTMLEALRKAARG